MWVFPDQPAPKGYTVFQTLAAKNQGKMTRGTHTAVYCPLLNLAVSKPACCIPIRSHIFVKTDAYDFHGHVISQLLENGRKLEKIGAFEICESSGYPS